MDKAYMLGGGWENRFSATTLSVNVLDFFDTLVPTQRRGELIGPTPGEPVTRTCSLGREGDSQPRCPSPCRRAGSVNGMSRSVCGLRQDRKGWEQAVKHEKGAQKPEESGS